LSLENGPNFDELSYRHINVYDKLQVTSSQWVNLKKIRRDVTFSYEAILTRSAAPSPFFQDWLKERGFLRQAQDAEFIEVQGQP